MGIQEEKTKKGLRFIIQGDLNQETARDLYEKMIECLNQGETTLLLDLEKCDFVSSSGLGTIAAVTMVARSRSGDLKVRGARTNVKNLFGVTKLDRIVDME